MGISITQLIHQVKSPQFSLSEVRPDPTLTSLLKGDLRLARNFYHAGFGSPYLIQDVLHLFKSAALASLAIPGLCADATLEFMHSVKGRLVQSPIPSSYTSLAKLKVVQKYIVVGAGLGTLKLTGALFHDLLKIMKALARTCYLKANPDYKRSAIVLIDFQGDFFERGPLAVPGATKAFFAANRMVVAKGVDTYVIASQDWHPGIRELPEDPEKHGSFATQHGVDPFTIVRLNGIDQVAWPEHCIQGTEGAMVKEMAVAPDVIVRKGDDPRVDSYSAFFDNNHTRQTKMNAHLRSQQIEQLVIGGVATDYCVRFSAEDALKEGYDVVLVTDAIAAIDQKNGFLNTKARLEEVAKATGRTIQFCTADEWIDQEASRKKMPAFLV